MNMKIRIKSEIRLIFELTENLFQIIFDTYMQLDKCNGIGVSANL